MANSNQVVCFISCQGFCTHIKWLNPEFQLIATNFMSIAAKLSDLVNKTSEANLQMEGHAVVLSQSAKDQQELDALGSYPSHLPSWSLARRLLSSFPNTKHCLEICVALTEELGAVPPPSHSWMAPLMEDMLHDVRTGLTEAVVTGPGMAVLFYWRCSMGEGLTADEARDAAFLLTGAGTWVGKSAYLAADPMTIQEGQWAIAQGVMDCQVRVRGPGHPHVNPPAQQPFRFDCPRGSPIKDASRDGGPAINHHHICLLDAKIAIDIGETKDLCHLISPHLPQSMRSRVTRVRYWMASSMLSRSDRSDRSWHPKQGRWYQDDGAHMKINLPVFKDEDAKDPVTYQSWCGI